jgi:hypothetical protein
MSIRPQTVFVNWAYPAPKDAFDRFIGPGATRAEIALQLIPPFVIAAGLLATALINDWGWSAVQFLIAGVLALDIVGGVITNATSAAKRWYHREGQGFRQHMVFILIHILQPALVVIFFDAGNWRFLVGSFGYLVLASLLILLTPRYLQRPLAMLLLIVGILIALYILPAPTGFEWFMPAYYVKLLISHLLREEPYRPAEEAQP